MPSFRDRVGHFKRQCLSKKHKQSGGSSEVTEEVETKSISAGEMAGLFQVMATVSKQLKANSSIKVPHMLYDQLKWVKQSPPSHPVLKLEASVSTTGYHQVGARPPPATRRRTATFKTLADTGCQACCMGPNQLHSLGMNTVDLLSPALNLRAANATGINILGAAFIYISGMSSGGKKWGTHQLVYIAEGLDQLILSKEACQSLGIIKEDFPAIGTYGNADINDLSASDGCADRGKPGSHPEAEELPTPCSPRPDGSCSCPISISTGVVCSPAQRCDHQALRCLLLQQVQGSPSHRCRVNQCQSSRILMSSPQLYTDPSPFHSTGLTGSNKTWTGTWPWGSSSQCPSTHQQAGVQGW